MLQDAGDFGSRLSSTDQLCDLREVPLPLSISYLLQQTKHSQAWGLKTTTAIYFVINLQFGQGSVERALFEFYVTKAEAAQTEAGVRREHGFASTVIADH